MGAARAQAPECFGLLLPPSLPLHAHVRPVQAAAARPQPGTAVLHLEAAAARHLGSRHGHDHLAAVPTSRSQSSAQRQLVVPGAAAVTGDQVT